MAKKVKDSRIVVITGATRGLGKALALELAREGHRVIGCGRNKESVAALKEELGRRHPLVALDVVKERAVMGWAARTIKRFGPPDLLINNAALMNAPAPLWTIAAKEFDSLIDVNIKGVANVIRAFVPAMVERGKGVIVNLSSGWGKGVDAGVAPYCATKWAMEGLTRALALELPRGLSAVPLNPGIIDTDMLRSAWGDGADRFSKPDAWARLVAPFILSLGPEHNGQPLDAPDPREVA